MAADENSADEHAVATSASGPANSLVAPAATLKITVRRDFPLRAGEQLGAWNWSRPDRTRIQDRMSWPQPFMGAVQVGQERPLEAEEARGIFGWGIGREALGSPGDRGGGKTSDDSSWGPIAARVELLDSGGASVADAQTSGNDGEVNLATTGLDGDYTVKITPDDLDNTDVGPDLATGAAVADLLYRAVEIPVTLSSGRLEAVTDPYDPPSGNTYARIGNRRAFDPTTRHLPVSLKPIWMKDSGSRARAAGSSVQLIIIHLTSGARMGNALNSWLGKGPGPHYVIDVDGHTIKLASDDQKKSHVSNRVDRWGAIRRLNDNSIGIEIINPTRVQAPFGTQANPPYTPGQYSALISLCELLVAAHPGIGHRIVGHCDVALGPASNTRYGTKRNWDPGLHFEWERLEARGLGMVPGSHFDASTSYDGVFDTFAGVLLQPGDRDAAGRTRVAHYGGTDRPGFNANAIAELQQDLRDVGYTLVERAGSFGPGTSAAVDRFKRHFFSGTRGRSTGGNVDQATATRVKDVADALRAIP